MTRTIVGVAVVWSALCVSDSMAGETTSFAPVLAKPGKTMVEDAFGRDALGARWKVAKGDWRIVDGAIVGSERKSDHHAAVIALGQPNRDSVIQFKFMFDGTKSFHLSLNRAKGHLFRVIVGERSVVVRTDKDKKDPASKPATIAQAKTRFEQGKWYTLCVEMVGDKVSVQADNGLSLEGSNPAIDVDKPNYRFVMRGASLRLDDVRVWGVAKR